MAQGIQDIANGLGLLYVVDLSGNIIGTQPNNTVGARQIRNIGAACAPISSDRPAVGTVTYTAAGGAGNITAVTINGVNQIGANVAATVGDVTTTASDVADAINSWTPGSGPNYTAQAIAGVVYIFSPPADGVTVNGSAITVSVSNVLITSTTTALTNGADGSGSYDSVIGLRFYVNAGYTSPVPTNSIASAQEITDYIVVRGLQSGIPRPAVTINGDRITTLPRYSAIQEVIVGTQGGAATDYLGYINPSAFSVGDRIRLIAPDLSEVTTVVDSTDTSIALLQRNITLTDATPFSLRNYQGINLVLTYDLTGGLVWVEDTRAISQGMESITRANLLTLRNNSQLTPGKSWLVSDIAQAGAIVTAATANRLELSCAYLALVPDFQNTSTNFGGTWQPFMAAPTLGLMYAYNQFMYESLTGNIGSAPSGDAVNWALIPYNSGEYISEVHYSEYDIDTNIFTLRRDKRGNEVLQDPYNRYGLTKAPELCMRWGDNRITRNVIDNASAEIQNYTGICYSNNFLSGAIMNNFYSTNVGVFRGNTIEQGSSITDIFANNFSDNNIGGGAILQTFGDATTIASNNFQRSNIFDVTFTGDGTSAINITRANCVGQGGAATTVTIGGATTLGALTIDRANTISIGAFSGTMGVSDLYLKQKVNATIVGISGTSTISNMVVEDDVDLEMHIDNVAMSNLIVPVSAIIGTASDPIVVAMDGVVSDDINLDDAGIYSGTVLTLPDRYAKSGGVFRLIYTPATATINEIQNATPSTTLLAGKKLTYGFYCESGLTVTFDGTVIGSAADGDYISDIATDVVVGNASTALADVLYMYALQLSVGVNIMRKDSFIKLI